MPSISIIIPVYNEEKNIPSLYQEVVQVIEAEGWQTEIIWVDDGSVDTSAQLLLSLAEQDKRVKYILLSRNFGQQYAISAGIDYAQGEWIIIMDADGQDPPDLLPELYQKAQQGFDIVFAKRKSRKGEGWFKRKSAALFYRLINRMTEVPIPIDTGDFRIISHRVAELLRQMPEKNKFLRGQIAWLGFSSTQLEYDRPPRRLGKTQYSTEKMVKLAGDGITSFSSFPLKLVTWCGFAVFLFAIVMMGYALYSKFILKEFVQGWTSLMIGVMFIGGIQMLAIGILGEYIGRIYQNLKNRPTYIVRATNLDKER